MFSHFIAENRKRITVLLMMFLLAGVMLMRYLDGFLITGASPDGIVSFELAKKLPVSVKMIDSWDSTAQIAVGMSMGFDFLFLLVYASFLSLLIFWVNKKIMFRNNALNQWIIRAPFIAASFDIIENIALIKLLLGDLKPEWSSIAYFAAMIKFGILLLVLVYILIGSMLVIKKGIHKK